MKRLATLIVGLLIAGAQAQASDPQGFDEIERGRMLAVAADCAGCHTQTGGADYAGGKAIETPFGPLLAPNITPDRKTGIGAWSDAAFTAVLAEGIGHNGEHIYPAMPYPYYTRMPTTDILAVRAYLNTVTPRSHAVVSNQLAFPFSVRAVLRGWNELYFTPGVFTPTANKSEAWNRGAYLVQGPGHCGACHTPKTLLGGDDTARALQGGVLQGWLAPNLTADLRIGLGKWSRDDIVSFLQSGHSRQAAAGGPMTEVVAFSTSKLPLSDLQAMALFLKDQPASGTDTARTALAAVDLVGGKAIYLDNCTACHGVDGAGLPGMFPALRQNAGVQATLPNNAIRLILQGGRSVATSLAPTAPVMPPFGWKLSDQQIAAVTTYIRNSWDNAAPMVSSATVHDARSETK